MNPAKINIGNNSRYKQGEIPLENLSDACINKKLNIPVVYRSSYELKFIQWLEKMVEQGKVIKWGSEVTCIPYFDSKGKKHRYYPDFYVEIWRKNLPESKDYLPSTGNINGEENQSYIEKNLIEIKPLNQTSKPGTYSSGSGKTSTKNLSLKSRNYQAKMYDINIRKWKAAQDACESKGIKFKIITENSLKYL